MDNLLLVWISIIIIMSIAEATTAQLVSIWFVFGAIAALISGVFNASAAVQIGLFVGVTTLSLLLTRPFLKKIMKFKKEDTNLGRYIGKKGKVIVEINNETGVGQVNVSGIVWTARSVDADVIHVGEEVYVESIEGAKLNVRPSRKHIETIK